MSIQDLILQNVRVEGKSRNWHHCKCKLCGDYKTRSSFKFEDSIQYNCFNCGANTYYVEGSRFMRKEFREVLNAFGIEDVDIDKELGLNFFKDEPLVLNKNKEPPKVTNVEVALPPMSYRVTEANEDDMWTVVADEYLKSRGLSLDDHEWYLSKDPQWVGRLIIPYFKNKKIIFWQGRAFDDNAKKRYINATVPIEPVLFGFDELERYSDTPLFIMEGVMDAISINGCSMVGSKLYKARIDAFKKSKRRLIFVIDRKDKENNGYKLGLEVVQHGWEITTVDGSAADVNNSVAIYGKLYTMQSLIKNAKSGFEANVYLEMVCKNHK